MINSSNETDFITFNPDTVWNENYKGYIERYGEVLLFKQSSKYTFTG